VTWHAWEELTTTDFAGFDAQSTVVVLPVAAIEQHGPHLPLGTDALLADAICEAARDRSPDDQPVLRLPTQRIGLSAEHASFAGTLTTSAETLLALWTDIGRAVAATGLRKLVIVNTHGGQPAIVDLVAQRLRREAAMLVVRANSFRFASLPDDLTERERRYGWHGGLIETSLMLRLAPRLVRRAALRAFPSRAEAFDAASAVLRVEGQTGIGWLAEDLNAEGVVGDASAATAAQGERLLTDLGERLAALIEDVRRLPLPPPGREGIAAPWPVGGD
jgi:creatinine amidohydrolase